MTTEQIKFKEILDRHCKINKCYFTSNDFHSIFNAINEYRQSDIECIANFMGMLNTPIGRLKFPSDFAKEAVKLGDEIIQRNVTHNKQMAYREVHSVLHIEESAEVTQLDNKVYLEDFCPKCGWQYFVHPIHTKMCSNNQCSYIPNTSE